MSSGFFTNTEKEYIVAHALEIDAEENAIEFTDTEENVIEFTEAEKEAIIAQALSTPEGRICLAHAIVSNVPKLLTAKEKFMEELEKGLSP